MLQNCCSLFEAQLPSAQFSWCCYGNQTVYTIPETVASTKRSFSLLKLRRIRLSKLHSLHWRHLSFDHGIYSRLYPYTLNQYFFYFSVTFPKHKKQTLRILVHKVVNDFLECYCKNDLLNTLKKNTSISGGVRYASASIHESRSNYHSPLPLGKATPDSASSTELFPELWSPITAMAGSARSFSTPRERRESMRSIQGRTFSS